VSAALDVSVVIPARDGLPDVLDAVRAARAQTLAPREIVLVDDASSDGTGDAVERAFPDAAGQAPVRVIRARCGSAAAARNRGWREARGAWVALLDADDLWFPDKLAEAARALAAAPSAAWFFSDGAFLDVEGRRSDSWFSLYAELPEGYVGQPVAGLIQVNFVLTSSVVVRRDALEALGGFDESLSHAEDLDLWIRLARRWPATASRRSLVRYQHRAGGLTRQVDSRLSGDVVLFERLAGDATLPAALRAAARRRAALSEFKMGVADLREDRAHDARAHFARALRVPDRVLPVLAAFALAWLPRPLRAGLKRQRWAARTAAPHVSVGRARLVADTPAPAAPAPEGRP